MSELVIRLCDNVGVTYLSLLRSPIKDCLSPKSKSMRKNYFIMENRLIKTSDKGQMCPNTNVGDLCETRVVFNKAEYDPFIDFLKGFCIICVVLTHCIFPKLGYYSLFPIWGHPAVPLFLLIQVFHAYKHGIDNVQFNWLKIWDRIIKPFLFVEVAIILMVILMRLWLATHPDTFAGLVKRIIMGGGIGPGAYYPWIYLQFAILLPLFAPVFKKLHTIPLAIFFIIFSQMLEIIYNVTNMPVWIYRLLFFRYIFLVYLGYILVTKGFSINKKTICLSVISLSCFLFFNYWDTDLSPFFVTDAPSWRSCHWLCYIYMCYLLLFIINKIYGGLFCYEKLLAFIQQAGRYSYDIFLFQMFYFVVIHPYVMNVVFFISGVASITSMLSMLIAMAVCIVPVIWYKEYRRKSCINHHT